LTDKKISVENDTTLIEENIESSNIIKDVSYTSRDSNGNEYKLEAAEGVIDQKENNYIFLTTVKGSVNLRDYNQIEILSDFGKYNINNYDTIFSKNVIIVYLDNKIKGEYLDFSWDKNLMIISGNVSLENNENSLKTDVIEVNLKTKDVKIYMYEEKKKVNIKSQN
jgi:lipopolysaccharide export system protein LptA